MADDNARGHFVWYELMTSDPGAAQSFYTKLIGWGTQAWEGASTPYTMWTNGERPLGGVMAFTEDAIKRGVPPNWLAYVSTPRVDDTVKEATGQGATVLVPPMDIPTVGRFAVVADPQGAVFAPFTPQPTPEEMPAGRSWPRAVGEVSWHELATSTDPDSAFRFYASLFGWEKTDSFDMGPMGLYQLYGRNGVSYGGMYTKPAEMPFPPHWLLYVRVPSVPASIGTVKELGGQVLDGPMEVPGGGQIAQCLDPQGAAFALYSVKPS